MSQDQLKKEQELEQTQPAAPGALIQVEDLTNELLQALGQNRTLTTLSEKHRKAAQEIAVKVTLDNTDELLKAGSTARASISAISHKIIGETRLGDFPMLNQLFSELKSTSNELDVQSIHRPVGKVRQFLISLFGKRLDPLWRFLERYKKVKAVLAEKRKKCVELIVGRETAKSNLKEMKKSVLDGFSMAEIVIAAGEIVIEREALNFRTQLKALQASANPQNVLELQRLKDMRMAITRLDNRVLALQNMRIKYIQDLTVIDQQTANEDNLRDTLQVIHDLIISDMEAGVAIGITIQQSRQAAQFGSEVQDMAARLSRGNLEALGHAQVEIHKVSTQHARGALNVAKNLELLATIVTQGTALMKENERLNAEARKTLADAESKFKDALEKDLQEAVKP